ncbi:DUF72 domain-containing protein [Oscillatoriales cyanobacterium LEGE 11467]|uniref:DUF72 domain-containing protein n=1 Tax=Zarconia navalis LEGE 11467 TaxID=1828826 RepID=A0A928VW45_9CYAN|nr:DUF72 domain-containing protein [Zarconia navalis]MBE9040383.1 DUF72 domain-containing protein [Zarconia navalis LEGE 11467]
MDVRFKLGCAVWAYRGWLGEFYPTGSRTSDFLHLYSRRFSTVEGNTTFYAIPDAQTVRRWALETPDDFEFCLKLPREFTHSGLLQPSIEGTLRFLEHMEGLGDKLGPVFAQLPPNYGPEYLPDLEAFLEALPENVPLALEVRHPDWFCEPHALQLNAILEGLGVGRVILDSRPIYSGDDDPQENSSRRKPKLPVQPIVTADFTIVRFISHPVRSRNEAFWPEWANWLEGWLHQGKRVYFFVHCPIEERSPGTARDFSHLLEARGMHVPPLPWDSVEQPPLQLSLF